MSKRIVGVSPWSPRDGVDYDLIKAAGIEWVRQNSEFPFGRSEEDITPSYTRWFDRYKEAKAAAKRARKGERAAAICWACSAVMALVPAAGAVYPSAS